MAQNDKDPNDGLIVGEAGEWAIQKHRLLADYVHSTWAVRRKFARTGARQAYVDLFSGPGKTRVEDSGEILDGSPLVAWKSATEHEARFDNVYVSDESQDFVAAATARLEQLSAPVDGRAGSAVEAAAWVADQLDTRGYHLAFVDPYNLADLPWEAFRKLTPHKHIDFIVHFSQADLTRNLDTYFEQEDSVLDRFAPGWRARVPMMRGRVQMRGLFFAHWISLFEAEGYLLADAVPLVRNRKGAPLYRLVLLSRKKLANTIWRSLHKRPQRNLFC